MKENKNIDNKKEKHGPSIIVLLLLVFAFKSSFLDANNIPTGSMIPTLKIGDFLFVNKMRYSFRMPFTESELIRFDNPKRGDIVTFSPPPIAVWQEYVNPTQLSRLGKFLMPSLFSKRFVKRVVGMPGDKLKFNQKEVETVNGKRIHYFQLEYMEKGSSEFRSYEPISIEAGNELSDLDNLNAVNKSLFYENKRDFKHFVLEGEDKGSYKIFDLCDNDGGINQRNVLQHIPRSLSDNVKDFLRRSFLADNEKFIKSYCSSPEKVATIPEGYYLVMGDNREDSSDSRYWGLVKREDILGKAMIIYLSINWNDSLCANYIEPSSPEIEVVTIPDQLKKNLKYCHPDEYTIPDEIPHRSLVSSIATWVDKVIRYKVPRMEIRWKRIGRLLK